MPTQMKSVIDNTSTHKARVKWEYSEYQINKPETARIFSVQTNHGAEWQSADTYIMENYPHYVEKLTPYQEILERDGLAKRKVSDILISIAELQNSGIPIETQLVGNPIGDALYSYECVVPIRITH